VRRAMSEPEKRDSTQAPPLSTAADEDTPSQVTAKGDDAPPSSKRQEVPQDPLEKAQAEVARLKDLWMRTAADFDNFRKRTRRELEDARRNGREDLLKAVLPVFDNLERAIQSSQRATDVKAVADGLTMVLKQFNDSLARAGIQKVPTVGHPFDPSVHEAIQQVETSEHPPGVVMAEVQSGYVQGDRLTRAAMVVVSKGKSEGGGEGAETGTEKN
jgi:molecular chaperone GrpE